VYNEYPAGRPTALLCTVRTGVRRPFCPAAAVLTGGSVPGTTNVVLIIFLLFPRRFKRCQEMACSHLRALFRGQYRHEVGRLTDRR
jgi:hypothetical protein